MRLLLRFCMIWWLSLCQLESTTSAAKPKTKRKNSEQTRDSTVRNAVDKELKADSLSRKRKVAPSKVASKKEDIMEVEIDTSMGYSNPTTRSKTKKTPPQSKSDKKLKKLRQTTKSFVNPELPPSGDTSPSVQGLRKRQKDVDYVRSVAPPPRPLPRYHFSKVKEFHPKSEEGQRFWWLKRLREKIEEKRDERKQRNNDRYSLNPNELHVVDKFLSKEDRIEMRKVVLRLKTLKSNVAGEKDTIYETATNEAKNMVAYPEAFGKASEEEQEKLLNIIAKVADYANENLYLNGTISDPRDYDNTGMHLGMFTIYEYMPDKTGVLSTVCKHTDSDFDGRCLSAALHLDNFLDPTSSYMKKKIKKKERQKYENEPVEGGVFQVMECTGEDTDCTGAVGRKLASLYDADVFTGKDTLRPTEEAPYKPGQLVFFLPESPHAVTPLRKNTRAVLFMWFNCHEFEEPPVQNPSVILSLKRLGEREEAKRIAKLEAKRARQRKKRDLH